MHCIVCKPTHLPAEKLQNKEHNMLMAALETIVFEWQDNGLSTKQSQSFLPGWPEPLKSSILPVIGSRWIVQLGRSSSSDDVDHGDLEDTKSEGKLGDRLLH